MLYGLAIFIFVLICILLMVIILLQSSKSGGMGGAIMGGGAINTAFGGHGADKLLVRITTGLAVIFMVLAISIQYLGGSSTATVNQKEDESSSKGLQEDIIPNNENNSIPSE